MDTDDMNSDTAMNDSSSDLDENHESDPLSNLSIPRVVIGIDFGTTFSSVAYTVLDNGDRPDTVVPSKVRCIGNYPGYTSVNGAHDDRKDVPTELWYDEGSTRHLRQSYHQGCTVEPQLDIKTCSDSESESSSNSSDRSHSEDDAKPRTFPPTLAKQYWGYQVQQQLSMMHIPQDSARPLTRFKLNLEEKTETQDVRKETRVRIQALIKKRIIKRDIDVYAHYLTHLLRHTKNEVISSGELQPHSIIQFVLCVPAKWSVKACRTMQTALEAAVMESGLGKHNESTGPDIFMISEPEAAAECILVDNGSGIYAGETIIIIDAGGGTVDVVTYKCDNDNPIRLSAEVVPPDSRLCGASYINERFEQRLLKRLRGETYLEKNNKTLESIAQATTATFEKSAKRRYDDKNPRGSEFIYIDDLRENSGKGFCLNSMELKNKTMRQLFKESVIGAVEVLESQLQLAHEEGHKVAKVILTGGFGSSKYLRKCLKECIIGRNEIYGSDTDFVISQDPSTSVARGAVLRALNKKFGPSRVAQCSYGHLLHEVFEPDIVEAHRKRKCRISSTNKEKYIDNTLRWFIKAGDQVENQQEYSFETKHVWLQGSWDQMIGVEQLWMSDKRGSDSYRYTHDMNKGAVKVGTIEADLTFLKDEGLIVPQLQYPYMPKSSKNQLYWEAWYELAMIVEGRGMRFESRWPPKSKLEEGQKQRVLASRFVSIVAAFKPGTM